MTIFIGTDTLNYFSPYEFAQMNGKRKSRSLCAQHSRPHPCIVCLGPTTGVLTKKHLPDDPRIRWIFTDDLMILCLLMPAFISLPSISPKTLVIGTFRTFRMTGEDSLETPFWWLSDGVFLFSNPITRDPSTRDNDRVAEKRDKKGIRNELQSQDPWNIQLHRSQLRRGAFHVIKLNIEEEVRRITYL